MRNLLEFYVKNGEKALFKHMKKNRKNKEYV